MNVLPLITILVLCYLIGSIPSGWVVVKIASGRDLRFFGSGRTGGTNAMRAAGFLAGFFTALLDIFKGISASWIVGWLMPGNLWMQALAPAITMFGQVYSIFLIERKDNGQLRLRGGAGGATCLGGTIGLTPTALLVVFPAALLVYIFGGYASLTTITIALISTILLGYRALVGSGPWQHVIYGIIALALVLWALRPNLVRVSKGIERPVGLRRLRMKRLGKHIPE
jgi:glycerol-3-phosphate acyltransferase PlsY